MSVNSTKKTMSTLSGKTKLSKSMLQFAAGDETNFLTAAEQPEIIGNSGLTGDNDGLAAI